MNIQSVFPFPISDHNVMAQWCEIHVDLIYFVLKSMTINIQRHFLVRRKIKAKKTKNSTLKSAFS